MSLRGRPDSDIPAIKLDFLFDDLEEPTEVTIFHDKPDRISTAWITADAEAAIPAEEWP